MLHQDVILMGMGTALVTLLGSVAWASGFSGFIARRNERRHDRVKELGLERVFDPPRARRATRWRRTIARGTYRGWPFEIEERRVRRMVRTIVSVEASTELPTTIIARDDFAERSCAPNFVPIDGLIDGYEVLVPDESARSFWDEASLSARDFGAKRLVEELSVGPRRVEAWVDCWPYEVNTLRPVMDLIVVLLDETRRQA